MGQAASWKTARRVVAKVEFHAGELFPRVGFIVTNLETPSRAVVRFYNKRGTAEQWIKEGKQAETMTRLSCHRFRSNQMRLALSLLAYNLGKSVAATGAAPRNRERVADESEATAGEDRRTAGKTCTLLRPLLAEGHLTRRRIRAMLGRIALLPVPTGWIMVVEVIGLTKGLGGSVARERCKMRQCGSTGADDKPQRALQDENLFHTVAISGSGCTLGAVFGK